MERLGGEHEGRRTSVTEVTLASVVGTVIEWYDFFIYGAAAAIVFPALFFPEFEPLTGTMAAFGTYALGFFARPLGGIIFGNYGDKIGRKTMLVVTLMLMGVATTLMGFLPTFQSVGYLAPVLLLVLRILQGLGAGAEFGGAVVMAAEYSPPRRRGLYASLPCTGVAIGLLLASGVFALFSSLPEEQFLSWGWRIPFLLSIVIVAVGLYIRLRIMETPVFSRVKESDTEVRWPVLEVVRSQPRNLLVALGPRGEAAGLPGGLGVPVIVRLPVLLAAEHGGAAPDLAGHHPGKLPRRLRNVLPPGGVLRGALRHQGTLFGHRARPRDLRPVRGGHRALRSDLPALADGLLLADSRVYDRAVTHNRGGRGFRA